MVLGLAVIIAGGVAYGEGPALTLHVRSAVTGTPTGPMTIELFRWSTDAERAPLIAALSAPTPPPAASAAPAAAGRGAGRAAGRGGRGGRGAAAAPPLSPTARLDAAIKAAPTCGYVWGVGVTGYSIKYAWRAPSAIGGDRIVLVTARRLGAQSPPPASTAAPDADADFTIIEMQLDQKGVGEAKASYGDVIVDAAAKTLALDGQVPSPLLLKVTR
ncbi:MAG TPA: hypothetical protein VKB50_18470 [Vicinamibacterales bacterium]|nr:hypothetical protein [Vicinamibacterales bacterium]